jgi:hypothetical protein
MRDTVVQCGDWSVTVLSQLTACTARLVGRFKTQSCCLLASAANPKPYWADPARSPPLKTRRRLDGVLTHPDRNAPLGCSDLIVRTQYPHDDAAFTQGLLYDATSQIFYESTGLYGGSSVRRVTPSTGEVLASRPLESAFFGEGLALWNSTLYQLTWMCVAPSLYLEARAWHCGVPHWEGNANGRLVR